MELFSIRIQRTFQLVSTPSVLSGRKSSLSHILGFRRLFFPAVTEDFETHVFVAVLGQSKRAVQFYSHVREG